MSEIKTILVPVDGSDSAQKAIDFAITLAKTYGAKIDYLYVSNINQLAINACLSDAILDAVNKAGDAILDGALKKTPQDIPAEAFSETGSPSVTILDFVEQHKADMVVMGSRGLGVVKGVLLGSVSQYVVEHAKCPIVIVK